MYLSEPLQQKWNGVLDHPDLPSIADPYRKAVTAVVLENQAVEMQKAGMITETTNQTGAAIQNFDPILISLVRRSLPNLIAYDVCGVQPMTGPTGLIFAMRSRYSTQTGTEAFYNEANTFFSGSNAAITAAQLAQLTNLTLAANTTETFTSNAAAVAAMTTSQGENLGDGAAGNTFQEMAFSIEKVTVTAKTRALKAEYSMELAQDLKAVHGLDAETELANILSTEILAEINREVIRTIYKTAESGAQFNTATAGTFDLDIDSNGRWSVEKFKGLIFQIERDANAIAQRTRRGKGNIIMCSSDVASALSMAGLLDYTPALNANLTVDDTGNTFAGVLNGKYKVYIDPYSGGAGNPATGATGGQYYVVGYKGSSPYDAGLFYCPYVPLQMVRAVGENTFQPKIGFKTRYGLVANPFAEGKSSGVETNLGRIQTNSNRYYRRVQVQNLM